MDSIFLKLFLTIVAAIVAKDILYFVIEFSYGVLVEAYYVVKRDFAVRRITKRMLNPRDRTRRHAGLSEEETVRFVDDRKFSPDSYEGEDRRNRFQQGRK